MAYIRADRVRETSSTTGTVTYVLGGAAIAHRAFSSVMVNGDVCTFCAEDGTNWEVVVGTWTTGGNLTRDVVIASSNAGAKVNWGAGTRNIFMVMSATELNNPKGSPAFPTISNMIIRLSAKDSVITKGADQLVTQISNLGSLGGNATTATTKLRYLARRFNRVGPCFTFDGTATDHLNFTLAANVVSPMTVICVVENLAVGAGDGNLYRDQAGNAVGYLSGGNTWSIFANPTALTSAAHWTSNKALLPDDMTGYPAVRADVYNGASSLIRNNGVDVTGTAGTGTLWTAGVLHIGNGATAVTSAAKMLLHEFVVFSKALSGAELTSIDDYYKNVLNLQF